MLTISRKHLIEQTNERIETSSGYDTNSKDFNQMNVSLDNLTFNVGTSKSYYT